MTVSGLQRTRRQLWSDLLVALDGSESYLTNDLSEREVLIAIRNTYSNPVSKFNRGHREEILASILTAAGGSASPRHSKKEMLAALVSALGGTPPVVGLSSFEEILASCVNAAETATTTLDPATAGGAASLSNGNLTLTGDGSGRSVTRSIASHSSGKYYYEATIISASGDYAVAAGLGTAAESTINGDLGQDADGMGIFKGDPNLYYTNAIVTSASSTPGVGDVVGIAVDITAQTIWVRVNAGNWNNSGLANPATAVGGASIATLAARGDLYVAAMVNFDDDAVTGSITLNFGGSAYAQTSPVGFGNW